MSRLIYLDTNVYIDHFDGRVDGLRPLGEFAFQVLKRTMNCEFNIVISSLVLEELFYNTYEPRIKSLWSDLNVIGKIVRSVVLPEDIEMARMLSRDRNTHFNDTLHAVVAQRMNAEYLVTRNLKDFIELQDLINITLPENL